MIAKLFGKISYIRNNYAVIDVNGVGYRAQVTSYTLGKLAGMGEVGLFIHTHVREDAINLFGFLTLDELEIFELLISVSGVGPKSALGILSIADPKTIRTAVLNEDSSILTRVSGIGKKTAERVILELKGKVAEMAEGEKAGATLDSEAIEALTAMGYNVSEAREALKHISSDVKDVGERVKSALKSLGKK